MSLTKATYSMIAGAPINVLDYGAIGDGTTDNTAALNAAFAQIGRAVFFPKGTYAYSSNLNDVLCGAIIGEDQYYTILKPGAAVTVALPLGNASGYPAEIKNFTIDGNSTTNATGIFFGKTSSMATHASDIYVKSFSGASGVAYRFGDVLKSQFTRLTAYQCYTGFLIQGVNGSFPTTLHLDSCVASDITGYGERVKSGYSIEHTNCAFESCDINGVLIDPSVADTTEINYNSCWFEANAGNNPANFHMVAATASRTIRANVKNCFFDTNAGGTAASSINFGTNNAGFVIDSPRFVGSYAGAISITGGAYGTVTNWCSAYAFNVVSYTPGTVVWDQQAITAINAAWTSWTPNYGGFGSMTFTSVTTTTARYKLVGKTLSMTVLATGTAGGVADDALTVSLPSGLSTKSDAYTPCVISNAGVATIGTVRLSATDSFVSIYLADLVTNWTLGSVTVNINITMEVQ
jgi:hypothetical protein